MADSLFFCQLLGVHVPHAAWRPAWRGWGRDEPAALCWVLRSGRQLTADSPPHLPTTSNAISQTIGAQKRRESASQLMTGRPDCGRKRIG